MYSGVYFCLINFNQVMADYFRRRNAALEEDIDACMSKRPGWSFDDHLRFTMVLDQYRPELVPHLPAVGINYVAASLTLCSASRRHTPTACPRSATQRNATRVERRPRPV